MDLKTYSNSPSLRKTMGIVPLALLLTLIIVVTSININNPTYNDPNLQFALQAIFVLATSLTISLISARAYLATGSINILLIGSAFFISGISSTVASWAVSLSTNESATIGNTGILVSSFVILISSIATLAGTEFGYSKRKPLLGTIYLLSTVAVALVYIFGAFDLLPNFLSTSGPTSLRLVVLAISAILYAESSLIFGIVYRRSKSKIVYWYCLGIGLFSLALISAFLTIHFGSLTNWISRFCLYLSGIYFLVALLSREPTKEKTTGFSASWANAFKFGSKQTEMIFRTMIETANEGVVIAKPEGAYTFVNAKMAQMLGYTVDEILGKSSIDFMFSDSVKQQVLDARKRLNESSALSGEFNFRRKDGSALWTAYNASPIFDSQGNHVANMAMHSDITEHKKAEEALKEREAFYRSLVENNEDGFELIKLIYDHQGKNIDLLFLSVNSAFERHVGLKREDVIGKTAKQLNPKEDGISADFEEVAKSGNAKHVESYSDYSKRWYDLFIFPYSHDIVGSFIRDITDRKNMETKLKEQERLAAIGATAGMVGHDIRNPLQAIVGDLYFARKETNDLPESDSRKCIAETLDNIEENIFYINKIVADLQDYARPLNPRAKESDLKSIIAQAINNHGVPKNIEVVYSVDKDAQTIMADADFLKRIIGNLTLNAVQAMPKGGTLKIRAFKDNETGDSIITVMDSGIGIPHEVKEKLFTPMFTTKSKGQGFGLAVVKRLTEGLGGSISFESQVDKGTTFTVRLPPPKR